MDTRSFDAIVVGSGISGGWAAKELTEHGLKTLVLERGRMVRHGDYPTMLKDPWDLPDGNRPTTHDLERQAKQARTGYTITPATKHWFVDDIDHPYTERYRFDWMRGYQVGGRSLVWGRQSYRWSDLDFGANAREGIGVDWPIRYADLAPWYDHVETFIGVSGQAEGLPQLPDGKFLPPMELNCVELDFQRKVRETFGRALTIGRAAHLTAPLTHDKSPERSTCRFRNLCMRGCPFGGYFSSNASTLPAAERTGNLTLIPDAIVYELVYDAAKGRATGVRVLDAKSGAQSEYHARVIFLCASTFGSTFVMLNSLSSRFPNGFGNDSGELGCNIMDHHLDAGASALVDGFEDHYYSGRRPNGFYIPRYRNIGKDKREYLRGFGYQGGAGREGWGDLTLDGAIGADLKKKAQVPGPWRIGMGGFGEILPNHENRAVIDRTGKDVHGLPILAFDARLRENELRMRKDMANDAAEMLEAAGYRDVRVEEGTYAVGLGIHEMGTARMGRSPKTSVLNGFNQVHACRNVYVTDGSCMASSACQNPSLTYMALTARAANHAVEELKRMNI